MLEEGEGLCSLILLSLCYPVLSHLSPDVDCELLKRQETSGVSCVPSACVVSGIPSSGCPAGGSAPVHASLNSPTSNPAPQAASLLSPPSQETVGFYVHRVPEPET